MEAKRDGWPRASPSPPLLEDVGNFRSDGSKLPGPMTLARPDRTEDRSLSALRRWLEGKDEALAEWLDEPRRRRSVP
jgi:hypothetical protein